MSVAISGSNPAYSLQSVLSAQIALLMETEQATSGSRITSAAVDPSGLAIYNNLETQSQGADTANENITQASDAVNVAQGATSTIQTSLSQINYRYSVLNLRILGHGKNISSFKLDGTVLEKPFLDAALTGTHQIEIQLRD